MISVLANKPYESAFLASVVNITILETDDKIVMGIDDIQIKEQVEKEMRKNRPFKTDFLFKFKRDDNNNLCVDSVCNIEVKEGEVYAQAVSRQIILEKNKIILEELERAGIDTSMENLKRISEKSEIEMKHLNSFDGMRTTVAYKGKDLFTISEENRSVQNIDNYKFDISVDVKVVDRYYENN